MSPSKHARDAARARAERQAAKRAAALRKKRQVQAAIAGSIAGVVVLVVAISLLTKDDKSSSTTVTQAKPTATSSDGSTPAPEGCGYAKKDGAGDNFVGLPGTPNGKKETATLKTSAGTIAFSMDGTKAPCTANSFEFLASKGYFKDTKCHRLTTSGIFVLQCGDPTGTGSGGPGYSFTDENLTGLGTAAGDQAVYPAGTVAMANSGANTNGSQFFLVYKDSPLAASYTPFGQITQGLDILTKIAGEGTADGAPDGAPKTPVTIQSFDVK